MKQLVAITPETCIPQEAQAIIAALEAGVDRIHIRKPMSQAEPVESLIKAIPLAYYARIVMHDFFHLAQRYGLGGIHLNSRTNIVPVGWQGMVSRSCHTLQEVEHYKSQCDYLFLSPICDSISKKNYSAAFSHEQLLSAGSIIDKRVIALGGITPHNVGRVMQYGFGGAAVLGCLWPGKSAVDIKQIVKLLKSNMSCCNL